MDLRNSAQAEGKGNLPLVLDSSPGILSNLTSRFKWAFVAFGLLTTEVPALAQSSESGQRWSITFIDKERCIVTDLSTQETYTAQASDMWTQFATQESCDLVRFDGSYPAEWKPIVDRTVSPNATPSAELEQTSPEPELVKPSQQDALNHATLLRISAASGELVLVGNDQRGMTYEASGVQFQFNGDDNSSCIVYAPGIRPYRIKGIVNPGLQENSPTPPVIDERMAVKPPEESPVVDTPRISEELRRSLYQALSNYCKEYPLTSDDRSDDGRWHITVPVNDKVVVFSLVPSTKEWNVSMQGEEPFVLQGIPYSVAARIFAYEGKDKLAETYAAKAGIKLPEKVIVPQMREPEEQYVAVPEPKIEPPKVIEPEEPAPVKIDTKSYLRLLSDHCKATPLTSANIIAGNYHIEVESNEGTILYDLTDRDAREWRVAIPGVEPFNMIGLPYSVAARIFSLEGNHELASLTAKKAGIRLEQKKLVAETRPIEENEDTPSLESSRIKLPEIPVQIRDGKVAITDEYNLATFKAEINAEALDRVLKGVLKGKGAKLIAEAEKNKLCPLAFAAIATHESDNGRSDMAVGELCNVFGIYNSEKKQYWDFDSVDHCIEFTADLLGGPGYLSGEKNPRRTIAEIQMKYCPIGAENDPKKLNRHWRAGVKRWMETLNGGNQVSLARGAEDGQIGNVN